MASSIAGVSLTTPPRFLAKATTHTPKFQSLNFSPSLRKRTVQFRPLRATPDKLSDLVAESVKAAQEACSDDPVSGECAAAWDTVEEVSAEASHTREKLKESSDPLENYCKDNPETDECRTYDN